MQSTVRSPREKAGELKDPYSEVGRIAFSPPSKMCLQV